MNYKILCFLLLMGVYTPQLVFSQGKTNPVAELPTKWTTAVMTEEVPLSEYPRPQLKRQDWVCLNGWWDYTGGKDIRSALSPATAIKFKTVAEKIHVPFCPESVLSGIKRKQEINMWYHRSFNLSPNWQGKNILLHFEGVDHNATVFVNGHKVGSHQGGYDSFSFDITPYIQKEGNSITVAAYDANDGTTPSGKNGPRGDYTFSSGIWQTVWLEPVNPVYIENVRLVPDLVGKRLAITVGAEPGCQIEAIAFKGKEKVASVRSVVGKTFYLDLKQPESWSPDHPFLYNLELTLMDKKGKVQDRVESYFGMRDIRLGKINGMVRPLLNGEFVFQLGLLDQGYWPDGVLTPPSDEALLSDMLITKKAGFNLIRKHMKTESKRFYYWADKLGLLVWQDMPAIWFQNKDTAINRGQYRRELKAIIDDHFNAPSIITWVPFNENWGAFDVREITDWVRKYDPSRLVNGNSGFNNNPSYQKAYGDPGNGDFVDTHLYALPYKPAVPDDHRAASLGEFGGVGLFVPGHMWPVQNNAYRYSATKSTLTDDYTLMIGHIDQWMKYKGLSAAVYTQTTDVEHEINGILSYDRQVEKMDIERVKKINDWLIHDSKTLNKTEEVDSME
ncbi:MAG TPA: glycoside hydrolase family 2 TIM barrel-domain containing protein [Arachidicoccus sp.]|nr:glycoside hydrolase family 2 TIM barrel-domain containing protein [Arachidicoccus sp.]